MSAYGNYISDIEGGYIRIGNLVLVDIRCTVQNAIPSDWTIVMAGLPYPIVQYAGGSTGATLVNNQGGAMAVTGVGSIGSYSSVPVGTTLVITGAYMAK